MEVKFTKTILQYFRTIIPTTTKKTGMYKEYMSKTLFASQKKF